MNVERSFDPAARLSTQTDPSGSFAWSYTPWNGLPASVTNAASGVHVAYAWDILDRPTNIVWRKADGDTLRAFNYAYGMAGCITNMATEGAGMDGRATSYAYDPLDRLTSETTSGRTNAWSYDLAENRTNATHNGDSTTYTLGIGDRLASTSDGATYLYSAAGCVTNISSVSSVPSVVSLSWNGQYQLTAAHTNGALAESYQYDALNRRISTTSGGVVTYHVYDDNWQVLADLDASGQPLRSYTWAPGIDRLLALTTYDDGVTNTYYALTDHLGTVHALADASGAIAESYEFDAWGNVLGVYDSSGTPIPNPKSQISNRFLWQGREYSWGTGLYHFRHRWYDPVTGRWLSNDPIGTSGGLNQYVFCVNDPVNYIDPWGLCDNGPSFWDNDNWTWFRPRSHEYITGSDRPNLLPITRPLGLTPGGYITGNLEDYLPFFHQLARIHDPLSGWILNTFGAGDSIHVPFMGPFDDLLVEAITIPPCYVVAASGTIVSTTAGAVKGVGKTAAEVGHGIGRGATYLGNNFIRNSGVLRWTF